MPTVTKTSSPTLAAMRIIGIRSVEVDGASTGMDPFTPVSDMNSGVDKDETLGIPFACHTPESSEGGKDCYTESSSALPKAVPPERKMKENFA